jgi:5-methylcytosine-specific restriction enzyme A
MSNLGPFFPYHFDPSLAYRRYMTGKDYQHVNPGHCRWCLKPVSGRRRSWCSDACQSEFLIRFSGAVVTNRVFDRDRGICELCGIDTKELEAVYLFASRGLRTSWSLRGEWGPWYSANSWWEADHIVPVSEGGGCCGLENYRTLCMRCHKVESAKLKRRMAQKKRSQLEIAV